MRRAGSERHPAVAGIESELWTSRAWSLPRALGQPGSEATGDPVLAKRWSHRSPGPARRPGRVSTAGSGPPSGPRTAAPFSTADSVPHPPRGRITLQGHPANGPLRDPPASATPCESPLLPHQVPVKVPYYPARSLRGSAIAPSGSCEDPLLPCQVPEGSAIALSGPREDPLLPHQAPAVPPPAPPACREALLWPCQNPRLLQNYFCRATASVTELLGSKQPSLMASCTHTHTHTHIYAHPGTHGHTHNHPVRAAGAGAYTSLGIQLHIYMHPYTHKQR